MNLGPSGYEPDELPGCSTPQSGRKIGAGAVRVNEVGKSAETQRLKSGRRGMVKREDIVWALLNTKEFSFNH